MFMKDDKNKKAATIIVSKISKNKPEEMREMPKEDGAYQDDEMSMVADEIMSAIEKKDMKMLKDSLKSFVSMCMDEDSEED